ncbi:MAG: glycosyltransferase [Candidatus Omnitrophica bacterium]|nr:glycosyltransferase [Candidatus Omnitrophota bacterium]
MKVAFFVYPAAFQTPGGGEVLLLKTKESLQTKGVSVKLFNQWEDKLKDFDILHVFSSVKDCLGLMEAAKNVGVKVALSPIYWSTLKRSVHEYGTRPKKLRMILQHMAKVIAPVLPSSRRKIFQVVDVILPNSEAEAEQVSRLFAIDKKKMRVVFLGADERFRKADKKEFIDKYKVEDFILSVGRIEPRKNQLNLIKAARGLNKRIVFVGNPAIGYEGYYNACKKIAPENTLFIERLEHSSTLLASAYAACSVFVLQGWFETPGLVALEAALAGARLAVTSGGSTREYFKEYVEYFNPASPLSICRAIEKSLLREKTDDLREYIAKNFLWENVAQQNIRVYEELLR